MTQSSVLDEPVAGLPGHGCENSGTTPITGTATETIPFGRFVVVDTTKTDGVALPAAGEVATLGLGFAKSDTSEEAADTPVGYTANQKVPVSMSGWMYVEATEAVGRGAVASVVEAGANAGKVAAAGTGVDVDGIIFEETITGAGLVRVRYNLPNRAT